MSSSGTYGVTTTHTHTHDHGIRMVCTSTATAQPHEQTSTALPSSTIAQHQNMKVPAAVPISVTTAAIANPSRNNVAVVASNQQLQQQRQQQRHIQMARIASEGMFQSADGMKHALSPQTIATMRNALAKRGISTTVAGGIPNKMAVKNRATIQSIILGTNSKPSQPPAQSNSVYSSAGRASVSAHQQALKSLEWRINSAPGNLSVIAAAATTSKTNVQAQGAKYKYQKVVGGKPTVPRSVSMSFQSDVSPQIFLDKLIKSRGYCTRNYCSLEGGYYCKPTPLQKASYGIRLVQAIRQSDDVLLSKMLKCGSSPNPCNAFGESVVHMVCRRGDYKMLKVFKEAGCALQVTDDFGRTPLHDACWTAEPNFETVDMILNLDERMLHIVDCRGSPPLSYVKRDHWGKWVAYFQSRAEQFWPPRDVSKDGEQPPPILCSEAPHSRPIQDPPNAMPLDVAQLISSGKMTPDDYLARVPQVKTEAPTQYAPVVASPQPVAT